MQCDHEVIDPTRRLAVRLAGLLEARFSVEFAVAAAPIADGVGLDQRSDGFVRRADVQAPMRRVRCERLGDLPGLPQSVRRRDQ